MAVRSTSFANYTTASTASITVPSGAASGDIVVVDLWVESSAENPTPPAGFTQEATKSISISGVSASLHRYWKRLTGSDTGTYSFTLSGSLPYMATAAAMTGRASSGSPFGTGGAASSTFGIAGSRSAPGAVSAASAAAAADALLAISGYDFGDDPTVVATGFTRQVANGDGQYLFVNLNMSSGAPGSVTPGGPSDAYIEILSILPLDTGGGGPAAVIPDRRHSQAKRRASNY